MKPILSLVMSYVLENGANKIILSKSFSEAKFTATAVQTLNHQISKSSFFNHLFFWMYLKNSLEKLFTVS
jgi:hypothetical protein